METRTEMKVIPLSEHARERAEDKEAVRQYPEQDNKPEYKQFKEFLAALEADKIRLDIGNGQKAREYAAHDAPPAVLIAAREGKSTIRAEVEGEGRQYAVVSGLTESALKSMQEDGHAPAVITETQEGRYQAVFKLSVCDTEQKGQIESTLCNRYGDGTRQNIVIPGFYAETPPDRLPRVVKVDEASQAQGATRMLERLLADAPRYKEQEEATRAYVAQAQGIQERPQQGKQEEPAQAPGFGLGIGDAVSKFVHFFVDFLKKLANLIAYAIGKQQPFAAVGKIEDRPAPTHWQKSQWNEQELTQQPVFAQKNEQVQEKKVERAPEPAQMQEETRSRSRSR